MIKQNFFNFFEALAQNNEREWFNAQKKTYEKDVKEPFLTLIEAIQAALLPTEPELALVAPKSMLFRINRDIRFSKDKRPYKEYISASIARFGTKDKIYPGHYLQIGAAETFVAGGAYFFEEKEMLNRVRYFIGDNLEEFEQIIGNQDFIKHFGEIKGEKNKRMPNSELTELVKLQPLIANTQFYWAANLTKETVLRPDFVAILRGYFEAAQPLNQFLVRAMYS